MNGKISSYIKIGISFLLLGVLFYLMRGKYTQVLHELRQTNIKLFILAGIIYSINVAITTLRMKVILKSQELKMRFYELLELNFLGLFFNNFMPSALGGDIVKAYYTGKITKQKAKSYVAVFMDRFTGLISFAFIGMISLVVGWNAIPNPAIRQSVVIFVILCFLAAIICLNSQVAHFISRGLSLIHFKNIGEKLNNIYDMLHSYKDEKAALIKSMGVSIFSQLAYFWVIYILFRSLGVDISVKVVFLVMPIVCTVTMLPSLGGLGIREGSIVALFGHLPYVGAEKAFGVSVLLFAILFIFSIIGGIIYATSPQFRAVKIKEEEIV